MKHVGGDVVLTVEDEAGKSGSWCCSVFRFAEPKTEEQLLQEALLGVLGALSPLTVIGRHVAELDYKLAAAAKRAYALLGARR